MLNTLPPRRSPAPGIVAWSMLLTLLGGCAALAPKLETPQLSLLGIQMLSTDMFAQKFRVRVHDHSSIERSVILPRVRIGENCVIRNAIVDEGSAIPDGMQIGVDADADRERFYVSEAGVTLVTASMLRTTAARG